MYKGNTEKIVKSLTLPTPQKIGRGLMFIFHHFRALQVEQKNLLNVVRKGVKALVLCVSNVLFLFARAK